MSLQEYCAKFAALKINTSRTTSPHKACMLLAVLDMARGGALTSNEIRYAPPLLERYAMYFDSVRTERDHRNPFMPFFHLTGALADGSPSFWHLRVRPGREAAASALDSARRVGDVTENFEYAYLDPKLFDLLRREASIDALAETLARVWFRLGLADLPTIIDQAKAIADYENVLWHLPDQEGAGILPPKPIRDAAFRRVIIQIYDYRCCATGARLVLPDGTAMVQAAHLHPFCEAQDDDPRNGLALTPDMHWAMDHHLIAPGPDQVWRASRALSPREPDQARLIELEGRPVLRPIENKFLPKQASLAWRMHRLLNRQA